MNFIGIDRAKRSYVDVAEVLPRVAAAASHFPLATQSTSLVAALGFAVGVTLSVSEVWLCTGSSTSSCGLRLQNTRRGVFDRLLSTPRRGLLVAIAWNHSRFDVFDGLRHLI
jgi:hypothetical protein